MDIHSKPIAQRIEWLMEHAHRHSQTFTSAEASLARQRYLAQHTSAVAALKCMDGRINLAVTTQTPLGIIQPFRNLGGMFDLGWPYLGEVLANYVHDQVITGRRVLLLITYHFSKGNRLRGCAGFNFDTDAARAYTYAIKLQVEHVFGAGHDTVYPIVCGFETDEDALVLHGSNGAQLDVSRLAARDQDGLRPVLEKLFPDMPGQIRFDLEPLVLGNQARIAEVRKMARTLDIEHREWMICVGRGFDFLHMPNLALIIGPYSPNLAEPISVAGGIIEENMRAGRIPNDGFLLLASVPYAEVGVDRARAELKSHFLSQFAADVIRGGHPTLAAKMQVHTAVLDWRSRALETIAAA
ncbi:MAG: carboxysome shell carbonic anhydrase [Gammaproteobacteria bacterium]|nr:carboxysome shell carbonic anhydrase [Gammaproteobacteria bacterium]MDH3405538.1 carboxysome shell carbonic anhydrase [Gammaproteobacteria bacterium]MDH3562920.1 carboxysome shell carbonic anhydrase [Gammaproteobacteria bacterium]